MNQLDRAIATVKALRAENGCPWDKEQTHQSLRRYLLEETYEVLEALDALDNSKKTMDHFREELGDLLLQVLLHSEIARQEGNFSLEDISRELADKLIRRHPHVFGENKLADSNAVLSQWEINKNKEKKKDSVLDGIPKDLPALQRSLKIIEKVSRVGFQWENLAGPVAKMREELDEFLVELQKAGELESLTKENAESIPEPLKKKLESEMGDLLFTVVNIAHFLKLNPEDSLRSMLTRFESRFRFVETGAKAQGKKLEEMTLVEMDKLWDEAKAKEKLFSRTEER